MTSAPENTFHFTDVMIDMPDMLLWQDPDWNHKLLHITLEVKQPFFQVGL